MQRAYTQMDASGEGPGFLTEPVGPGHPPDSPARSKALFNAAMLSGFT